MAESSATLKGSNIVLNDTTFERLINSAGIYNRKQIQWYDKFNRFGFLDPYNSVTTTREYIFITKPDLHLFENYDPSVLNEEITNMPIFRDALVRYNSVLKQLQYSTKGNSSPFVTLLSNSVKSTLDIPGISSGDIITSSNIYGTNLSYRKSSIDSDQDHEFSLEFDDTKYLEVYMYFKLFDEYERKKYHGTITPPNDSYRLNKILHDQSSIFKIIVGEDNETIIYYAKLYGCYPKTVPRDAFSDISGGGNMRFTVTWKCNFIEDMEPNILSDFNTITLPIVNSYNADLPLYDETIASSNGDWANIPYIIQESSIINPMSSYKLKWR